MTTCSEEASVCVLESSLRSALHDVEAAERDVALVNGLVGGNGRHITGSFYTPADTAEYFWDDVLHHLGVVDQATASQFIGSFRFIDPAVGAGSLLVALIHALVKRGVKVSALKDLEVVAYDVNPVALQFVSRTLEELSRQAQVELPCVRIILGDSLERSVEGSRRRTFFFANPPFVRRKGSRFGWKNSYGDFVSFALDNLGAQGIMRFIVPLSLSFSRDYAGIRRRMRLERHLIRVAHYDNIPDSLFKFGKPEHHNTNKANSQRCTFLTVVANNEAKLESTELHFWSRQERQRFFARPPMYVDVTDYAFDDQFPRPGSKRILAYLESASDDVVTLGSLLSTDADASHELFVGSVARNFIPVRSEGGSGCHRLRFASESTWLQALLLLSSDLFFDYWRCIGDGFHITRTNILRFPIAAEAMTWMVTNEGAARRMWERRALFSKAKRNAGKTTVSYDFSKTAPQFFARGQ